MKWIGLTGGIATGKSTVTSLLRTLGYAVIDADEVAHAVTAQGTDAVMDIVKAFGPQVQNPDGSLDRKMLARIVFGHADQIKKLEKIVHPLIVERVANERRKLEEAGTAVAFYDVPLLFEKKLESNFDAVVLVWAEESQQRARLASRNQLSESEVEARLKSQMPIAEKKSKSHHIIDNSKDLTYLRNEVDRVLKEIRI